MPDDRPAFTRVALLAGGVGGARMAEGLARALPPGALSVIANVGDDDDFHGLRVCPDIDTLLYTLAGPVHRGQGWGRAEDSTHALAVLKTLGNDTWMTLGDADLGLHIWRTQQLRAGRGLVDLTAEAGQRLGARARVIPATDAPLRTRLRTDAGWQDFQTWFVRDRCIPAVRQIAYAEAATATAAPEALAALAEAELIVVAPSNPLLSIAPILAIPGIEAALRAAAAPRIGVSPVIRGVAVKGPLARLLADLGRPGGAMDLAGGYADWLDGWLLDPADLPSAHDRRPALLGCDILMPDPEAAEALARRLLAFATTVRRAG